MPYENMLNILARGIQTKPTWDYMDSRLNALKYMGGLQDIQMQPQKMAMEQQRLGILQQQANTSGGHLALEQETFKEGRKDKATLIAQGKRDRFYAKLNEYPDTFDRKTWDRERSKVPEEYREEIPTSDEVLDDMGRKGWLAPEADPDEIFKKRFVPGYIGKTQQLKERKQLVDEREASVKEYNALKEKDDKYDWVVMPNGQQMKLQAGQPVPPGAKRWQQEAVTEPKTVWPTAEEAVKAGRSAGPPKGYDVAAIPDKGGYSYRYFPQPGNMFIGADVGGNPVTMPSRGPVSTTVTPGPLGGLTSKVLSEDFKKDLEAKMGAEDLVSQLKRQWDGLGITSRASNIEVFGKAKTGYHSKGKTYLNFREGLLGNLSRSIAAERGVLTQQDIDRIAKIIPELGINPLNVHNAEEAESVWKEIQLVIDAGYERARRRRMMTQQNPMGEGQKEVPASYPNKTKTVVRTGTVTSGENKGKRKTVYSDGSVSYE